MHLDRANGRLWRNDGKVFDPEHRVWTPARGGPDGEPIGVLDAGFDKFNHGKATCLFHQIL